MSNSASQSECQSNSRVRKRSWNSTNDSEDDNPIITPSKLCEGAECSNKSEDESSEKVENSQISIISKVLECAVCLQICVHPARLPCGHIFCFLCLKGFAHGSKCCAMCRQPIPSDYLDNPDLVEVSSDEGSPPADEEEYKWFYEGRNGWWQYDFRTCSELETAYRQEESRTEVLIAGYLYIIDLVEMVQLRKSDPNRRRNIKRDFATCPKKGIAGLRQISCSSISNIVDTISKLDINQK